MPPTIDLTNTIGALLIGVVFSSMLYGVTILQAFLYFQNYPSDGIIIKGSVILLLILETLHSVFSVHAIYYYLVSNYMNPVALRRAVWSATMTLISSSAIIFLVHLFYIRRIYLVSNKNIAISLFLLILVLSDLGTSIGIEVRAFQLQFYSKFNDSNISMLAQSSLALAAATDILISGILSFYLHAGRSGIRRSVNRFYIVRYTDTIINRLMAYTINNGILTSAFDIIVVIFVTTANDLRYLAVFQVVGNIYTNSMLATLNSRQSMRSGRDAVEGGSGVAMSTFKVTGDMTTSRTAVGTTKDYSKQKSLEIG